MLFKQQKTQQSTSRTKNEMKSKENKFIFEAISFGVGRRRRRMVATVFAHDKKLTDWLSLGPEVGGNSLDTMNTTTAALVAVYKHNRWKIKFLKLLFKLAAYADMKYGQRLLHITQDCHEYNSECQFIVSKYSRKSKCWAAQLFEKIAMKII